MSTTSLKLSDELKQLAVAEAERQGVSPHAFMVEAIRTAAEASRRRASFVANAVASREAALQSGQGYAAEEVHAYAQARAEGRRTARPKVRTWRG